MKRKSEAPSVKNFISMFFFEPGSGWGINKRFVRVTTPLHFIYILLFMQCPLWDTAHMLNK